MTASYKKIRRVFSAIIRKLVSQKPLVYLKNIGTCIFLSAGRLVNMFMMPFPQFTVLPTAHAQFYGKLMVCLSSFRGLVGRLSGYITTCKTLADLHCKAA